MTPSVTCRSRAIRASVIWAMAERNQGSIPVASARRSTETPRRSSASSWKIRSGVAVAAAATRSSVAHRSRAASAGSALRPEPALLEGADGLLERLGEGPPDAHHLADRLHAGPEPVGGPGQLLEGPPGDLGHHVVDGGLEATPGWPR